MVKIDPDQVTEFMREVGQRVIMPRWRNLRDGEVSTKTGPEDYVTIADREAEVELSRMLAGILPGSLVVGEEAVAADPALMGALQSDRPVWIIDPVDGTRPFTQGDETFGIIIALTLGDDILAGWIHHPLTGDTLVTEKGSGAFFGGARVHVRDKTDFAAMAGILGMRLRMPVDEMPGQGPGPQFVRRSFVSCQIYPAMLTGEPLFGLPVEPQYHFRATGSYSRPWDDAAGVLALREGGGEVIDWTGALYRPSMFDNGTIAANNLESALLLRDWLMPAYRAARDKKRNSA